MSYDAIIDMWPTLVEFAADVGVPERRVRGWRHRDSIPGQYWQAIVDAAKKRGHRHVTLDVLAKAAIKERVAA